MREYFYCIDEIGNEDGNNCFYEKFACHAGAIREFREWVDAYRNEWGANWRASVTDLTTGEVLEWEEG